MQLIKSLPHLGHKSYRKAEKEIKAKKKEYLKYLSKKTHNEEFRLKVIKRRKKAKIAKKSRKANYKKVS
jgi:hypothetical protein